MPLLPAKQLAQRLQHDQIRLAPQTLIKPLVQLAASHAVPEVDPA